MFLNIDICWKFMVVRSGQLYLAAYMRSIFNDLMTLKGLIYMGCLCQNIYSYILTYSGAYDMWWLSFASDRTMATIVDKMKTTNSTIDRIWKLKSCSSKSICSIYGSGTLKLAFKILINCLLSVVLYLQLRKCNTHVRTF